MPVLGYEYGLIVIVAEGGDHPVVVSELGARANDGHGCLPMLFDVINISEYYHDLDIFVIQKTG